MTIVSGELEESSNFLRSAPRQCEIVTHMTGSGNCATVSAAAHRLTLLQASASFRVRLKGECEVSIENWSESIVVAELQDDPAFSDDVTALMDQLEEKGDVDVVLNLGGVAYVNSSNIAKLLKLRKKQLSSRRRLILCNIDTSVWGIFMVTGLDKVFDVADNVATALAAVQISSQS